MNRRFVHYLLFAFVFLNPLFFTSAWAGSDTFLWIGGATGNWEDGANWKNLDFNTTGDLPDPVDDVMIDGSVTVTINSTLIIESVQLSGGATLIIAVGASLSTTEGGLDGSNSMRLDDVSPNTDYPAGTFTTTSGPSSLIVRGALNLDNDDASGSGLSIGTGSSVTVDNNASLSITNAGTKDQAINIESTGSLTNNGTITLINPGENGIRTTAGNNQYGIFNNGTLNITGGDIGLKIGSIWMENSGTVTVSGTSGLLIDLGGRFKNKSSGTFGGNGTVEVHSTRLILEAGSTIAPGNSPGTLTFDDHISFNGVTLSIEINGTTGGTQYDQIVVQGNADLSGSTLSLSGSYAPVSGDQFTIVSASGSLDGNFGGGPFILNGVEMTEDATFNGTMNFQSSFPVELTSFIAKPANKTVQLHWTTATETNNDYFSIEHSTDGRYFQEVGKVTGAGTTQAPQDYAFIHSSPAAGLNYYRLNQYDFDGAQEYSPVQTVEIDGKNTWAAWPILAHDRINLDWAEAPPANTIIEAYNLAGQKVYSQPVPEGAIQVQIPVQQWASGWHSIVVQQNGAVSSQRVIKE